MPGSFSNAIITTAGSALLARVEAGQATMEVTKVAVGDGLYSAAERTAASLSARTSLKAQKNIYTPSSATVMSEDSIKIKTIFSNYDAVEQVPVVTRGYFINELAVYCKENGGAASTEVLYCIAVTSGETGNYMPAYVGGGASQIVQDIFLTVGIAATTYVNKAGAAFLATEGQALKSEVASIKTRAESNTSAITALDTRVNGLIGSATPTPVATAAQMTDTSIIYVYTGSETGCTPGDWYYYDSSSSSWKSGGEYGAALIDPTLSQEGQAADAKVAGEWIEKVENNTSAVIDGALTRENVVPKAGKFNYYWNVETNIAVYTNLPNTLWYAYETPILVEKGEIYKVKALQGATHKTRIWIVTDESYNILSMANDYYSNDDSVFYEEIFTIPDGGKYLLLTTRHPLSTTDIIDVKKYKATTENINNLNANIFKKELQKTYALTKNYFWNVETGIAVLTPLPGTYWMASSIIPVKEGESYEVTGKQGPSYKVRIWVITDDEMNILATAEDYYDDNNHSEKFIVPEGGTKLVITTRELETAPYAILYKTVTAFDILNNKLLYGKTVAVLGDSISTNGNSGADANVPEITIQEEDVGVELSAYLTYYDVQDNLSLGGHTFVSSEIGTEVTFTPTEDDVGKSIGLPNNYNPNITTTWWEVMQEALGNKTIPVCWSGSSITSHESSGATRKTAHAWHPAQIRKCGKRIAGTMQRTAPDIIIIYRGTNDFSHEPYTLLTQNYFDSYNWQYPVDDAVTGGYGFKEGLCLTIAKLREAYPNAQIFLCTLNVFKRINYSHFPTNNGIDSLPQYNNAIREVANFMGCGVIEFDKDGITFENCYTGGYITDSATIPTHPTDKGHKVMGNKAIADLKAQYNSM